MREEKESITFFEEGYDSSSRYSRDGRFAYSIPEDGFSYRLRSGCVSLELKGRESLIDHLILPPSFASFDVGSIRCLPYLRKITAYSEFYFVSSGLIEHDVTNFWKNTSLKEICVLPWLVDKYKRMFGFFDGFSESIVKVTAISDEIAYKLNTPQGNGLVTSNNGTTLLKVDKNIKILEIPINIERVAATAFDKDNRVEKIVLLGNSEDYNKDRRRIEFDKNAVNSLIHVETLVFKGPLHDSFYDDPLNGAKMPNLKTIIYPLWNYNHFCFRGSEAEFSSIHDYEIKAENFSSVELIEEDGIVYTKDGKFLVSGVDCKLKSVRIKKGVKEIFQYAFCCNKTIEEVYIPNTVTKVGSCAFKSCRNMKKVVFNFEQLNNDAEYAFSTFSPNVHFYFPDTRLSDVLRRKFDNIHIHTLPNYHGDIIVDERTGNVFDEFGNRFVGKLY